MRKETIIKGAFILMSANLITRLMGFYYRTCMVRAIGTEGMGLYQLIMPIYMLTWSITSSGLTTTVSKLTAQESAKKEFGNAKRFLRIALVISLVISTALSIFLFIFSKEIAIYIIQDDRTAMPLQILSLAIPFMALGSCSRGYFMGLQKQIFPAISQIIEQIVRIASILLLSSAFLGKGIEYACMVAVWGIVLGEAISYFFTLICLKLVTKKNKIKLPSISKSMAFVSLCSMAVPLTLARVTGSVLSTAENILIPQRLALFPSQENALATFGSLTGMAMPLIQLPSAILVAISITMVPALSETQAIGRKGDSALLIEKALCYTAIIGCGVLAIFTAFPEEICYYIYGNRALGELLFNLSFVCPFLYLNITILGILNGLGHHGFIFKLNLLSSVVNLFFIYFLIPEIGVNAFIIGVAVSLIAEVFLSIKKISANIDLSINFYKNFFTPVVCAASSFLFIKLLPPGETLLQFIINISTLSCTYVLLLFLTGALSLKDFIFIKQK